MNASCQCGAIKFKTPLPKPLAVYICHCDECRLQSGSAYGCSAIFPAFKLPGKELLSCYSRPTASGHLLNCYFCKSCGTRVIHSTPGKNVVSVKGGCIEGLDFKSARHIWCKRAMVPIPEGVERHEEEPDNENYAHDIEQSDMAQSDGGGSTKVGNGKGTGKGSSSSASGGFDLFDGMRG
ncbi:Mss4-like protein [Rhexocercosporidium sp. MPI-PUGE-AT-0058]|nr:Mss4-like protein [Rhexocercosporidium sp. MPI-PUGE-AT-0058]